MLFFVTRIKYQIRLSNWPVCCLLAHVLCTGSVHCFILFSFLEFVCVYFWSKFINNNNDRNMKQIFVCGKFKIHLFFQRKKNHEKCVFILKCNIFIDIMCLDCSFDKSINIPWWNQINPSKQWWRLNVSRWRIVHTNNGKWISSIKIGQNPYWVV